MDSDSDKESMEGDVAPKTPAANWGKAKHDYYYTDYVDKDYPSKLTAKEERLAAIEQEEALRIQKKLLSTLDNVDLQVAFEEEAASDDDGQENLIDFIERQNKAIAASGEGNQSKKRKRVQFEDSKKGRRGATAVDDDDEKYADSGSDGGGDDDDDDDDDDDNDEQGDEAKDLEKDEGQRRRRPINAAMKHNRGLTPYKKKEYRNPRVKHKLKYKKAMSKRRRNVKEAQIEYHRYSGEATGIKTSTIKSIKLC